MVVYGQFRDPMGTPRTLSLPHVMATRLISRCIVQIVDHSNWGQDQCFQERLPVAMHRGHCLTFLTSKVLFAAGGKGTEEKAFIYKKNTLILELNTSSVGMKKIFFSDQNRNQPLEEALGRSKTTTCQNCTNDIRA